MLGEQKETIPPNLAIRFLEAFILETKSSYCFLYECSYKACYLYDGIIMLLNLFVI